MHVRLALHCAIVLGALLSVLRPAAAQSPRAEAFDSVAIRVTVLATLEAEQQAFRSRDCERSVSYFADLQPLFVVSGRVMPSRTILSMACGQMVAPGAGAPRQLERHVVHVLSATSAFSVSIYRVPPPEGAASEDATRQVVTKIWILSDDGWRIGHFHESSGPFGRGGPAASPRPPA